MRVRVRVGLGFQLEAGHRGDAGVQCAIIGGMRARVAGAVEGAPLLRAVEARVAVVACAATVGQAAALVRDRVGARVRVGAEVRVRVRGRGRVRVWVWVWA